MNSVILNFLLGLQQMRLFLSFLSICFLLFFGINDSFAGARQHSNAHFIDQQFTASQSTQFTSQVSAVDIVEDYTFYLNEAFEDEEDDDEQNETVEKCKIKHSALPSASFLFSMSDKRFSVPTIASFLAGQTCPIYISQRVLRI